MNTHPSDYMNGFFSKPIGEKATLVGEIGAIFERQPTEAEARATWRITVSYASAGLADIEASPNLDRLAQVLAPYGGQFFWHGGAWEGQFETALTVVMQADTQTVNRVVRSLADQLPDEEWAHVENSKLGVRYVKLADFR